MITDEQLKPAAQKLLLLRVLYGPVVQIIEDIGKDNYAESVGPEGRKALREVLLLLKLLYGRVLRNIFVPPTAAEFTQADALVAKLKFDAFFNAMSRVDQLLGRVAQVGLVDPLTDETIELTDEQWTRVEARVQNALNASLAKLDEVL